MPAIISTVQPFRLIENQQKDLCSSVRFSTPEKNKTKPTNFGP